MRPMGAERERAMQTDGNPVPILPQLAEVKVPTVFENLCSRFRGRKLLVECRRAERFAQQMIRHLETAPAKDADLRARMLHNARFTLADLRANIARIETGGK